MGDDPLARAVIIRTLKAQVNERLQRGEPLKSICADLLSTGIDPGVIDRVLDAFRPPRPPVNWPRVAASSALSVVFVLGLSVGLALLGVWVVTTLLGPDHLSGHGADTFATVVLTAVGGLVGLAVGLRLSLAAAARLAAWARSQPGAEADCAAAPPVGAPPA